MTKNYMATNGVLYTPFVNVWAVPVTKAEADAVRHSSPIIRPDRMRDKFAARLGRNIPTITLNAEDTTGWAFFIEIHYTVDNPETRDFIAEVVRDYIDACVHHKEWDTSL